MQLFLDGGLILLDFLKRHLSLASLPLFELLDLYGFLVEEASLETRCVGVEQLLVKALFFQGFDLLICSRDLLPVPLLMIYNLAKVLIDVALDTLICSHELDQGVTLVALNCTERANATLTLHAVHDLQHSMRLARALLLLFAPLFHDALEGAVPDVVVLADGSFASWASSRA